MSAIRWKIETIVDEIRTELAPMRIILFGAYAFGRNGREGDEVELLAVIQPSRDVYARAASIRKTHEKAVPLTLMLGTPDQISRRLVNEDPWVRKILESGEVLYDAPGFAGSPDEAMIRVADEAEED